MNHDPIAEMLTVIRNGQQVNKHTVTVSKSKFKVAILNVLKDEGYITKFEEVKITDAKSALEIQLSYYEGKGVITHLKRVSKCSCRRYTTSQDMSRVFGGMGQLIVSTSHGVYSDSQIRKIERETGKRHGGEIIAEVA